MDRSILTELQNCQEKDGYITKEAVHAIADDFKTSDSDVFGVATFYHQFTFRPRGKTVIQVCLGTACFVMGGADILACVENELGIRAGETTKCGTFSIEHNTRCLGDCANAPVVLVGDKHWITKATPEKVLNQLTELRRQNAT